jgi:hypothetical protein
MRHACDSAKLHDPPVTDDKSRPTLPEARREPLVKPREFPDVLRHRWLLEGLVVGCEGQGKGKNIIKGNGQPADELLLPVHCKAHSDRGFEGSRKSAGHDKIKWASTFAHPAGERHAFLGQMRGWWPADAVPSNLDGL